MEEIELNNSEYWFDQADANNESANLILESLLGMNSLSPKEREEFGLEKYRKLVYSYMSSYMLLSGYAIENYLKGGLIAKSTNSKLIKYKTNFKLISKDIFKSNNSHKLLDLAIELGIEINVKEENFLQRLEIFVMWAGRYYFPKTSSEYQSLTDGSIQFKSFDPKTKEEFVSKIRSYHR